MVPARLPGPVRPAFPIDDLKVACDGLSELIVLERALSPGVGGIIGPEVRAALSEAHSPPRIHNFAAGLGGRDVPLEIFPKLLEATRARDATRFAIIDVDTVKIAAEDR